MESFSKVYENKVWKTGSGRGSSVSFAASTICRLIDVISKYRIETIIDAPCGDQQWAHILRRVLPNLQYVGVDVVPGVIMRNKEMFQDPAEKTEFFLLDITEDGAFQSLQNKSRQWKQTKTAIFSRHVLEHHPYQNIFKIVNNIRASKASYFIGTWQPWAGINNDIDAPGGYRALDFTKAPFNFPFPRLAWMENEDNSSRAAPEPFMALWSSRDLPTFGTGFIEQQDGRSVEGRNNLSDSRMASGIPLAKDMLQLREMERFHHIKAYSDAFVKEYADILSRYSWRISDPFMTWSRQYEYTYVFASVKEFAQRSPSPVTLLDMGSGVTFFDFFLSDSIPESHVVALDSDETYTELFNEFNLLRMDHNPVHFHLQDARQYINLPDSSFDVVVCVSVLEHTDDYEKIVASVHRLLRPGGAFIVTFDIATSSTKSGGIQPSQAANLLNVLSKYFAEAHAPSYEYTERSISQRIRGDAGQIMDVSWVNENLADIAGKEGWTITISCHVFYKAQ